MAVMTGWLTLLVVTGSNTGLAPVAKFVIVPREMDITFNVRFVVAPTARLPRLQTTWLLAFVVVTGTELINTSPTGKLSVTVTLLAIDGPKFVTDML